MALTTQQLLLIEQRLANEKKSTTVAYLLWFFLPSFGAHRFYLGRPGTAVLQMLLFFSGLVLLVPLIPFLIWIIVDAFLIPGMIRQDMDERRARLGGEYGAMALAD